MTYRTKAQARIFIGGVLVYAAVWAVAIVQILAADDASATRRAVVVSLIVVHLVLVIWFVGVRCGRAGVVVDGHGIVVRNPARSHRLSWDAIESFTVEPQGLWTQGYVHMKEGDSVPIFGIQGQMPARFPKTGWAEEPIGELNKLLAENRARVRTKVRQASPATYGSGPHRSS